jgi:hypothetical protein
VYSLFPIYTDDTLVYFPELLGRWEMEGGEDYIKFSTKPKAFDWFSNEEAKDESEDSTIEKDYLVEIMDGEELMAFVGHIAKIGDDLFLDLYPDDPYSNGSTLSNVFPVHTFVKLKFSGKQLYMTPFDLQKLNKLFESNLIRLRHENVDGMILITAQPKEIQKFIDRYSEDESVFEETETYQKAS